MGTRSITCVLDDRGNKIIEMYKQYDGYPSGLGKELVDFINGGVITNGISMAETRVVFNGIECFAAQLVAHFKSGAGGIYLHAPTTKWANKKKYNELYWADYYYEISLDGEKNLKVECWNCYDGKKENLGEDNG